MACAQHRAGQQGPRRERGNALCPRWWQPHVGTGRQCLPPDYERSQHQPLRHFERVEHWNEWQWRSVARAQHVGRPAPAKQAERHRLQREFKVDTPVLGERPARQQKAKAQRPQHDDRHEHPTQQRPCRIGVAQIAKLPLALARSHQQEEPEPCDMQDALQCRLQPAALRMQQPDMPQQRQRPGQPAEPGRGRRYAEGQADQRSGHEHRQGQHGDLTKLSPVAPRSHNAGHHRAQPHHADDSGRYAVPLALRSQHAHAFAHGGSDPPTRTPEQRSPQHGCVDTPVIGPPRDRRSGVGVPCKRCVACLCTQPVCGDQGGRAQCERRPESKIGKRRSDFVP